MAISRLSLTQNASSSPLLCNHHMINGGSALICLQQMSVDEKSKILEEKCKSQKGGLFINAFDAYHSLVLPRVEGWANFGKAGPRINHDKNISFLAITPSSPLLYITSPPTLPLPTRSPPLCQKDLYVLGPSVLGLKNLAISRKIN